MESMPAHLPQIPLEDIGKLKFSQDGKNVWVIENLNKYNEFRSYDLPPRIYIVDFPALGVGQQFLLGRHLCGPVKYDMLEQIGHTLAQLCKKMGFFDGDRIAQFIIYFGGKAYDMDNAKPPLVSDAMIDTTLIKYQRVHDKKMPNGFRVKRRTFLGQWWKDNVWLVLEECVASGSTITRFGNDAIRYSFKKFRPEKIFVFPACGSFYGIQELWKICREYNIEFIPVFNSVLFDVAPVGLHEDLPYTDLGLRPLTIATSEFVKALRKRYQDTLLCTVGDIGDSVYHPKKHSLETIEDMRLIGMNLSCEDFSKWNPIIFTEEFRAQLKEKHPLASEIFERWIKKHPSKS